MCEYNYDLHNSSVRSTNNFFTQFRTQILDKSFLSPNRPHHHGCIKIFLILVNSFHLHYTSTFSLYHLPVSYIFKNKQRVVLSLPVLLQHHLIYYYHCSIILSFQREKQNLELLASHLSHIDIT